jgi:hypothetical protein
VNAGTGVGGGGEIEEGAVMTSVDSVRASLPLEGDDVTSEGRSMNANEDGSGHEGGVMTEEGCDEQREQDG